MLYADESGKRLHHRGYLALRWLGFGENRQASMFEACILGAYRKCGFLFKDGNKGFSMNKSEAKKEMVKLNRKTKIAIAALVAIAIVLAVSIPYAAAQTVANNAASNIRTLHARGNIYQAVDSSTIKYYQANLTLTVQPTSTSGNAKLFDVTGGTLVTANGDTYTFTAGNGGVLTGRHVVLLQAQGTDPSAQAVTLKLAGQYSYSWIAGKVALKIGAKLETQDGNYTLLMLAPI